MGIKKHRRRLASGEEKVYTYEVSEDGSQWRSLSIRDSSVSPPLYRNKEKKRIVAALLANSSLLVVSEPGAGKSFLAEAVKEELEAQSFMVAAPRIGTVKQVLMDIIGEKLSLCAICQGVIEKKLGTTSLPVRKRGYNQLNCRFSLCFDNS